VVVPAEAVLFNATGLQVAVIGDDNKVQMRQVTVYRDFGTSVELSEGLKGGERVALSPPVDIHDGETVKPQGDK
jgi:multidrug efflux pump subunit AcrA (membrane-fusion protein)